MKRLLLITAVVACGLLWSGTALAANGDLIATRTFDTPCPSGIGVGIAYDGTNLWYSCAGSNPDLYRADPTTGVVSATYNVDSGLGALAYDATRNAIWAGPGMGSTTDAIQLIQLDASRNVTSSSVAFTGPGDFLDDGLAYDATNDTLYVSPDGSTTIEHYTTSGTFLESSPWAGNDCYNSGLALGGTLLYEGSDGCNHIWVADKSNPAVSTFDFASPNGVRDEDLECDPNTFQPTEVMWSMEAYEPRRASAFEIPAGSCGVGGQPGGQNHGRMTGGLNATSSTGARVTAGLELHCTPTDGPNNLQANWGKGSKFHLTHLDSATCTDDPAITPNPPAAGFDTFGGSGTGTYNGASGATATWTLADAGEPGSNDTVILTIKDASNTTVLTVSGKLGGGNLQAHAG